MAKQHSLSGGRFTQGPDSARLAQEAAKHWVRHSRLCGVAIGIEGDIQVGTQALAAGASRMAPHSNAQVAMLGLQCASFAADGCQMLGAAMQALWRSSSRLAAPPAWHKSATQWLPVTGTVCMAAAATAGRAALHLLLQTQQQASELLLLRLCLYPKRTLTGPGDCFVVEQQGLVDIGSHILAAAFVPGSAGVLALMHT